MQNLLVFEKFDSLNAESPDVSKIIKLVKTMRLNLACWHCSTVCESKNPALFDL